MYNEEAVKSTLCITLSDWREKYFPFCCACAMDEIFYAFAVRTSQPANEPEVYCLNIFVLLLNFFFATRYVNDIFIQTSIFSLLIGHEQESVNADGQPTEDGAEQARADGKLLKKDMLDENDVGDSMPFEEAEPQVDGKQEGEIVLPDDDDIGLDNMDEGRIDKINPTGLQNFRSLSSHKWHIRNLSNEQIHLYDPNHWKWK